ncbi:hypothetical protein C7974DRAFT_336537, partial [Boeremia exigua]|uniref:uncharacterized protein n=1 Tax=Boeremia exigua TaxID=749465 RepID=UPI001E8DAA98
MSTPAVARAENISLLHLLHLVPVPPSSNVTNKASPHQGSYALSYNQERHLTGTLAFICNTRDDSDHTPALCIEEDSQSASLNVMLAVNRADEEDGSNVLQDLKEGLEKIFGFLSGISKERNKSRAIEAEVFTAIIAMCSHRILRRLRLVGKDWGIPTQSLGGFLGEAINSLRQVDPQTLHSLPVGLFTERAKEVIRLSELWAIQREPAQLERLVGGIHQLKQAEGLQAVMDSIPNSAMCATSKQNLVNIVSKVSRYREAARFLSRTARRVPVFRRAKVVTVNLPKEGFSKSTGEGHTPQLRSTIARISTVHQEPDFYCLCRVLKTSESKLNEQFAARTAKTLRAAKIHAEVQLVAHYELNASKLPPRVVCSSKNSCFLCNALILMHGKMHTPRYHGRMDSGWKLPSMSNLSELELNLNSALEDQIRDSLKRLLLRPNKTINLEPNGVAILTLPSSTSTLPTKSALLDTLGSNATPLGSALASSTAIPREHLLPPMDRVSDSLPHTKSALSVPNSKSDATPKTAIQSRVDSPNQSATNLSSQHTPPPLRHKPKSSNITRLTQGAPQTRRVVPTLESEAHVNAAGALRIHVECATPAPDAAADARLTYGIEWLSAAKARELLEHRAVEIVDVEALRCGEAHAVVHRDEVFVRARGAVV